MNKIVSTKTVTARKDHRCDFCNLPIQIGNKYNRQFNVGDDAFTWKSHIHCQNLVDKIVDWNDVDDGISSDDFYNHVAEEWSSIYGKPHLGRSYHKMLDEVLRHHALADANCEPIQVSQNVWDIAPEREEVTECEELNQPRPQLKMKI